MLKNQFTYFLKDRLHRKQQRKRKTKENSWFTKFGWYYIFAWLSERGSIFLLSKKTQI